MLLDGHRHRSPSDPRRARRQLAVALAVAIPVGVLSAPAASYVTALAAPGSTDWQTTSVEWVRDHGGGPLVDTVENWWYAHNRPTGAVPAAGTLPTDGGAAQPATAQPATAQPGTAQPPALPLLAGQPALAHEAEWVPNPDGGAAPALYSAYFRPNADYPSQIVGVAWMNQAFTSTHLFAGTAEPVPGTTPTAAQVLDIHPKTVTFTVIRPSRTGLDATKLLPAMVKPADRYLVPDHRDFLAVTLRTGP